eukprot:CAMPEP_0113315216 /NCGR_PEP_ID=MMETSP0010_2-20120614/10971_1 /TAXON_ID=216773 ORGANISM="Corethron hystrix, Strain 308" /NCGR_SAMPLE_ID=MMETSP0010_2 /ASSEMBLY_ACC=CAM_ASM_000155 /LENGTH=194 /DNA_ID=CAMNT_0000171669 /DNA_START=111 /DNA_END=692 /DNA_ORIENTATION=+ /assembly_acc=CAM_ASM_000155
MTSTSKLGFNLPLNLKLGNALANGSTAVVYEATTHLTEKKYAVKIINHSSCLKRLNKARNEIEILRVLDHPGVSALRECFYDDLNHYLVMDFADGGDLLDDLQKNGRYSEKRAMEVGFELMGGVLHCHDRCVVHRDLKPENILLGKDGSVKIGDFGLSKQITKPNLLSTYCGSSLYMAPEILLGQAYDESVDIW